VAVASRVECPEAEFVRAVFGPHVADRAVAQTVDEEREMALRELRLEIAAALEPLPYRERGVLQMRYGLGDGYSYTLAECGFVFNLTRERIRQLQVRAIERVQRKSQGLREFIESLRE